MQSCPTDSEIKQALSTLEQAYYSAVRSVAEGLIAEICAGRIKDSEGLMIALEQDVDGNEWVIYTYKASQVLVCTENLNAASDAIGSDLKITDPNFWSGMAYFAMHEDVVDELRRRELDPFDDESVKALADEQDFL